MGRERERRRVGSPIPERRSLKRMVLSILFLFIPLSPPLSYLTLSAYARSFASPLFPPSPPHPSLFISRSPLTTIRLQRPRSPRSSFHSNHALRNSSRSSSSSSSASLPRIRQDYLSFGKGRSRLNLKHHLNKREVTAPSPHTGRRGG